MNSTFPPAMQAMIQRRADPTAAVEVRDFYERYPYPRPISGLEDYRRLWGDRQRRRADYHLHWPFKSYAEDPSILIAGCGTSQAAKHAMRWPAGRVTGIDFSATSLRCSEELKRRHNLDNLQLHQLAVERAAELGTSFDQIVCTGVLHHLPEPDWGLGALRSALKPGGAMHLMVYAPYGRAGIYMLQDFCRRVGIHATDDGIRELMTALTALPPGHPLQILLREASDFQNEAALADALLHPQDRAYSVPQLFNLLDNAGLVFGRWVRQAPYSTHCGLMARLPQASRIARLSPKEQYAVAELFRGTMVRHSVIAYRDDSPDISKRIDFAGRAWVGYVPVRAPDTICVQERLPPGAAAVLINRTHTSRDIYLPINATEQRMFEAIDGERSVGEIAGATLPPSPVASSLETARAFFERLWWHDEVVFDASPV